MIFEHKKTPNWVQPVGVWQNYFKNILHKNDKSKSKLTQWLGHIINWRIS